MDLALNNDEQKVLYCTETEIAFLGALIIEPAQFPIVASLVRADMFASIAHQTIYAALHELYINDKPIDLVILTKYLQSKNELEKADGAVYLSQLINFVALAHNIEYYARIIMDHACRRRIFAKALQLYNHSVDATRTLDQVIAEVGDIMDETVNKTFNISQIVPFKDHLLNYTSNADNKDQKEYLKPYIHSIREYVQTWKDGELIIVAGRPGMGKTAFVLWELYQQAKLGNAILFFSVEMKDEELITRLLAAESQINSNRIEYYDLSSDDWETLDRNIADMEQLNFYIDDQPHMTLDYILTQAKVYKKKYNIKAIAIDYLQLIELPNTETRALQIAHCTRKLKVLARSLDLPLFLICQLNRETEHSAAKGIEPMLSHLRESGAIEQDADKVLFPIRLSYYYPEDPTSFGKGYVKIAKNRKGKTGKPLVNISNDVTRWTSVATNTPF